MFHYDRGSRSGMVARELLECYRSIVQCDGYAAYEQFEQMKGITLVGCWAHGRRKYVDALEETGRWSHRRFTTSVGCTR